MVAYHIIKFKISSRQPALTERNHRFVIEKKFVKIPSLKSTSSKGKLVHLSAKPMMEVKIASSRRVSRDFEEVNIEGAAKAKKFHKLVSKNSNESVIVFLCRTCNVYFPTRQQLESHNNSIHVKSTKQQKSNQEKLKPTKKKVKNVFKNKIQFSGYFKDRDGTFRCQFCPFSSAIRTTVSSHSMRKHCTLIRGIESPETNPLEEPSPDVDAKEEQVLEEDDFYWPIETLDEDEEANDSLKVEEEVLEEVVDVDNDLLKSIKSCQFCLFQTTDNSLYCEHVKENHRESWLKSIAPKGAESTKVDTEDGIVKKCKFCSFKTLNQSALQSHYRKTHTDDILQMEEEETEIKDEHYPDNQKLRSCPYCPFETYVTSTFNSHVTRLHLNEKGGSSKRPKQLSATQHTGYACNFCSFVAASVPSLKNHTVREHAEASQPFSEVPVPEFDCDQCEFKTTNRRTMQHHSRNVHRSQANEEGMFCCGACSYETQSRMGLQRHVSIKHFRPRRQGVSNYPLYECDQCKFQSFNTWIVEWHMKQHYPEGDHDGTTYRCNDCNYSTWTKSQLYTHIHRRHRTVDGNEREPKVEPSAEEIPEVLQCKHCDYTTKNKHVMKVHIIRKHTEVYNHECEECGKKYKVKADLTNHIRFQHREQPIMCDVCGRTCRNSNLLYLHQKFHHYKPEFECPVCHRHLSSQTNLDDHILKQHEQQQDYVCEECGKKFNKVARLKIHLRVHTGVKPYTCKICCRAFARRNGLRQHLLIHTGKKPYTCDICQKTFTQKTGLISHRKSHPGNHPPLPRVTIDHVLSDLLNEPDLTE